MEQWQFYFRRNNTGNEGDCIVEDGLDVYPVEIKSGRTILSDHFKGLNYYNTLAGTGSKKSFLVYGGNDNQKRTGIQVLGWKHTEDI